MNWLLAVTVVVAMGCIAGLVHCHWMLRRNDDVTAFRTALINKIAAAAERDEVSGKDPSWRWAVYNSVTYEEMLRQRRRPLKDFYLDYSFTE